jgi:hypothetical protein
VFGPMRPLTYSWPRRSSSTQTLLAEKSLLGGHFA